MAIKINNRRFRSPKGKKESNLIPTSKWVINCRTDGTAPKAWDTRLPSSVKAAIRELEIEKEKKAKKEFLKLRRSFKMENYSRWLPTREATAYLGVSSQFLKKNRDIKNGFLIEEKHYILGANINSSILWNVSEILKEFHYRGRLIKQGEQIISELKKEVKK